MKQRTYISAVQRLAALPEVFTGGDLTVLFGWKSALCSNYLAQWRKAGLVQSLGGRSDVHMNLVVNRQANPELALARAYPQAIKVGLDVLREAGWTTQIPSAIDVAVPAGSSLHGLEGFALSNRTASWFSRVIQGTDKVAQGINRLHPAWALADMLARAQDSRVRNAWLLDPEDIDLHSARNTKSIALALAAFSLEPDSLENKAYELRYSQFKLSRRSNAAS